MPGLAGVGPGGLSGLGSLRNRRLERRLGDRLGPRFAAFDRELAGCLDGRFVRRDPATEVVEHGEPRPLFDVSEDAFQLGSVQGLLFQQLAGQSVQHVAVFGQDFPRFGMRRLDKLADLFVDLAGDLVGVVRLGAHGTSEERVAVFGAVFDRAQLGAHSKFGDH
ncbi:Uncharacterised protein [Mycobacterium tuberculosis]|nr:Uncharacterised protein [Mycobacterium tuberculosis]CNV93150.1 Uncharacterised protein [Mycobacterium tuberculosis]